MATDFTIKITADGTSYNLIDMVVGKQKIGFLDHLSVAWISLKSLVGTASRNEQDQLKAYNHLNTLIKTASKCVTICQTVLPEDTTSADIEKFMCSNKLTKKKVKKIKNQFNALKTDSSLYKNICYVAVDNHFIQALVKTVDNQLSTTDSTETSSSEFSEREKNAILTQSGKLTEQILKKFSVQEKV